MGDMADWQIENMLLPWDGFGYDHTMPQCKYCGEPELEWKKTDKGWRLFDGNKLHICKRENNGNIR